MTLLTISGRLRAAVQRRRRIAGPYRIPRVGFLVVAFGISASLAAADPAKHMFNIEAKPATQSLTDYARQAHIQLGYDVDAVEDVLTNAVAGEYDSAEALELLLEDTGLAAEYGERGVFIRRVAKRQVDGDVEKRTPPVAQTNSLRFAQTLSAEVQAAVEQTQTSKSTGTDSGEGEKERAFEEIIVTGTNIRGIAPESSPARTFTRGDIQISGAGTAQDFIQTLPQNFGGGSNSDIRVGLPNDNSASFNSGQGPLGSSINLRGLGSDSTLVLLNGHRVAPSSGIGDFVDVSMIPASAIERVEVLTDGASSIYGADAVAGVVNFVLRDDHDGVESSIRYGTVTEGALDEYRANISGGGNWDSGNALLIYEYLEQDSLSAADRSFSQNAALPNDLLPKQERHSVLASASQELAPDLTVYADFLLSNRKVESNFTNPTGGTSHAAPSSESLNVSAGGSWRFSETWYLDIAGTFSDVHTDAESVSAVRSLISLDSNIWVVDGKASGSILQLPGGDVKLAIGSQYRTEDFTNFDVLENELNRTADRNVYAFFGEAQIPLVGPHNARPGLERFEVNVSARFGDFSDFGSTANPKFGVVWSPYDGINLRGSYGTSFNPPPLGRVGANDNAILVATTALINSALGFTSADRSIDDVVLLKLSGTDKNLDAEDSTAFTAGLDLNKQFGRHSFKLTATWFDIEFRDRLGSTPVPDDRSSFDAHNIAFDNPELFPDGTIIFSPSQSEIQDLLDRADSINFFSAVDPLDAAIINNVSLVRNLSLTFVNGIDFYLGYTLDVNENTLSLGLDGTYLANFQQQAASTTPLVEQVDTLFDPVDLRIRGRAGFASNGFTANIFVNYADDYRIDNTAAAAPVHSWTTADLSMSYDTREQFSNSIFDNIVWRVSILNLFDEDPPATTTVPSLGIFGFDPTNATPLGRFVAIELTKAF